MAIVIFLPVGGTNATQNIKIRRETTEEEMLPGLAGLA